MNRYKQHIFVTLLFTIVCFVHADFPMPAGTEHQAPDILQRTQESSWIHYALRHKKEVATTTLKITGAFLTILGALDVAFPQKKIDVIEKCVRYSTAAAMMWMGGSYVLAESQKLFSPV